MRSQESPIKAPSFLLVAVGLQSAFAGQPSVDRQDVLVPSEASYICKGDFNNDGITDLAVNNGETSGISILLGKGDGTFRQPPIQASTDAYPDAIAAADFNGDHNLDLIVLPLSGDFGSFELLLGNGDGTFQTPQEIAFPNSGTVWYVLTPDLNHDGAPDLVFAADGRDEVIVLLGNGDGTFQSPEILHIGGNVALGDFNNDGNLDISASFALYSPYFKVALDNGDGTFQAPIVNEFPCAPLASADLNGDGLDDLILNFNGTALLAALSASCGVYRDLAYSVLDQENPAKVIQGPSDVTVTENFSNFSGFGSAPQPLSRMIDLVNAPYGDVLDTVGLAFPSPHWLTNNQNQSMTQVLSLTYGSRTFPLTLTNSISMGNFSGTLKDDVTISHP